MSSNSSFPSIRSLLTYAHGLLSQFPLGSTPSSQTTPSRAYTPFSDAPSCPSDSPLSCHNTTAAPDSCCFIYPGGQLLQTQFWDTDPAVGPTDSWTLHGLWSVSPFTHSTPDPQSKSPNPFPNSNKHLKARSLRWHVPHLLRFRAAILQHNLDPELRLAGRPPNLHEQLLATELRHFREFLGARVE